MATTKDDILGTKPKANVTNQENSATPESNGVAPTDNNVATMAPSASETEPASNSVSTSTSTSGTTTAEPNKDTSNVTEVNSGIKTEPAVQPTTTQKTSSQQPTTSQPAAPVAKTSPKKSLTYTEMFEKMNPNPQKTKEQEDKEKKQKRREAIFSAISDGINSLSNLYFTTKGAPNMYDARNTLSDKSKARWDKLAQDYEASKKEYLNGYMRAKQADDENARDERNWRHTLDREGITDKRYDEDIAHRDKREGIDDQRYDENIAHRDKREGIEDQRYDESIVHRNKREAVEDSHWQKQFNETIREFNVSSAREAHKLKMEGQRLHHELKNGTVTFSLGTGKGTISISSDAINNPSNISYVFNKLPQSVRNNVHGDAIYDSRKKKVVGYKEPSTDAMLIAIGANIENSPNAQIALKEMAGIKPKTSKTAPTPKKVKINY